MTGKPYSSIPWDIWIEMIMNKGSKKKAGWISILRNEKQLMADTKISTISVKFELPFTFRYI